MATFQNVGIQNYDSTCLYAVLTVVDKQYRDYR